MFNYVRKMIFGAIDRIFKKISSDDPKIKRLRKKSDRLQKEIEDQLIDMFGSLDKVPPSYRKQFNLGDRNKENNK